MLASRLLLTRNTAIRRASRALLQQRSFGRSAVVADDDLPYHIVVGMPALSPTMETGILAEWYIGEGATFGAGQAIAKIETDKASIDFEAQDDGVIAKILVDAGSGEDIPVGTPIMVTVEEEEDVDAFKDFEVPAEEPTEAPAAEPVAAIEETPPPPPPAPVAAAPPAPEPVAVEEPVAVAPPEMEDLAAAVAPVMSTGWGEFAKINSPIAKTLANKQKEYIEKYGTTGQVPL